MRYGFGEQPLHTDSSKSATWREIAGDIVGVYKVKSISIISKSKDDIAIHQ